MVKNTTGGKHKNEGRKYITGGGQSKLRLSENDAECYAVISKMFGNGMCQVNAYYNDNEVTLLCHIRGKFRSRNKKSNFVSVGSTVLIGVRDWESKVDKCDLLEVYDQDQTRQLNSMPSVRIPAPPIAHNDNTNDVVFTNEEQFDEDELLQGNTNTMMNNPDDQVSFEDV